MKHDYKTRELLLKEAKMRYSGSDIPAIHPRYGALYKNIYPNPEEKHQSTFRLRLLICLILFALFAALDQGEFPEIPFTSTQISLKIEDTRW